MMHSRTDTRTTAQSLVSCQPTISPTTIRNSRIGSTTLFDTGLIIKKPIPVMRYFTREHSSLVGHLAVENPGPGFCITRGPEDFSLLNEGNCRLAASTYPQMCRTADISNPPVKGLKRPIIF